MNIDGAPRPEAPKNREIERKFIIDTAIVADLKKHGFQLDGYPHEKIDQGYLANTPDGAVRVRRKGPKFFLTYKAASASHVAERIELETELTADQFEAMWPGTEGRRVEKTRYKVPSGDGVHTIELDVFEGEHAGHVLAEVEFASTAEADAFQPPVWFGTDVTADKAYGNASIAEHGFPESYSS